MPLVPVLAKMEYHGVNFFLTQKQSMSGMHSQNYRIARNGVRKSNESKQKLRGEVCNTYRVCSKFEGVGINVK